MTSLRRCEHGTESIAFRCRKCTWPIRPHHENDSNSRHMHKTVVVYAVLLERGFMFKEQIVGGSLTLNSQAPRPSSLYTNANGTNASYCCDSTVPDDCPANSTSILPCAFWDEYQTEYPPSAGSILAISTRVTVTKQSAPSTCDYQNWGPECVFTDDSEPVAQFINGAEDYTIRVRTFIFLHATRHSRDPLCR